MEYVLLAGAVCVVFFSCAQLMTRDKQPIHYFMITGCLCASYAALYLFALEAGLLRRVPALAGTDAAVTFPAAASFYPRLPLCPSRGGGRQSAAVPCMSWRRLSRSGRRSTTFSRPPHS